jgi:subtilisin family serine protease
MRRLSILIAPLFVVSAVVAAPPDPGTVREHRTHVILQAHGPLTVADRAELAGKGIDIQSPLPGGRYMAALAPGVRVSDARVGALEPLEADRKIFASARRAASLGKTWADLDVVFHEDISFDEARSAVLAAGAALADPFAVRFSPARRIRVKIAPAMLGALAADERVLAIGGRAPWKVRGENANTARISHVTELYSAPYNLTGAGVAVSLFELAPAEAVHPEFGGRLEVFATGGSSSDKSHATHVAGTIAAAGIRAEAKGMAPAAKIYQFCVPYPGNTCENELFETKDLELTARAIKVDNNSWGYVLGWDQQDGFWVWQDADIFWGAYSVFDTAPLDDISAQRDVLFVHSAGNDGDQPVLDDFSRHRHVDENFDTITDKLFCYSINRSGTDCPADCTGACESVRHHTLTPFDTIGLTAAAKNVIAVGAMQVVGGETISASFSSRGPAKDGRVKPDVVARGTGVLSTVPGGVYGVKQGTSMASPAVTGIAALLTEQWRKTFAGATPSAPQLKAVIIAGADDIGNPGPDYTFGFGLANAKNAADLIIADDGEGKRIATMTLDQGATDSHRLRVSETQNLRVVLTWADPAILILPDEEALAPKALVNDLDVRIIGPTGTETLAYVLDKNQVEALATRGVNTIDNTEMVEIPNAAPGIYEAIVTGSNVADGPQKAVLVANAEFGPACQDQLESNDTAGTATGDLLPGVTVSGTICPQTDVDFFKFTAARTGAARVTVTAGDTALRVTVEGTGVSRSQVVAANTTDVITFDVNSAPNAISVKIEPDGAIGFAPTYRFTPEFSQGPRRRSVRK